MPSSHHFKTWERLIADTHARKIRGIGKNMRHLSTRRRDLAVYLGEVTHISPHHTTSDADFYCHRETHGGPATPPSQLWEPGEPALPIDIWDISDVIASFGLHKGS